MVAPIHPKAMPVILRTAGECDAWLTAGPAEALTMQRSLPDDALKIAARGEKEDPPPGPAPREDNAGGRGAAAVTHHSQIESD